MRMPSVFAHDKTVTQPVVWVTTFIIVAFHIGALAALFLFSWKAFLGGHVSMVGRWGSGCRRRISQTSYASRLQNSEVGGIFSNRLRHADS